MNRFPARVPWLEIALLAGGFLVLGVLSAVQHHEAPVAYATNSTFDTAPGGYGAWYELLQREGIQTERFEQPPAFLDRSVDTLIVADIGGPGAILSGGYSALDAAALAKWVRGGGRVVLLRDGISVRATENEVLPKKTAVTGRRAPAYVAPDLAAFGIRNLAKGFAGQVPLRSGYRILLAAPGHVLVTRYRVGTGVVDDVYAREPFENGNLLKADAARLALFLGSPRKLNGVVAFDETFHGHMVPYHWWNALPKRFVIAVVFCALVLAFAVAGTAIRLGPPLIPEAGRSASSSEYVDAVATLLERRGAVAHAIRSAAEATRRAVHARGALASSPSLETNLHELERLAALPHPSERQLIGALACSFAIRKDLLLHGRTG